MEQGNIMKKHLSPMQIAYWLTRINPRTNMCYTEEEARFHIKSFRKSNIEYWTSRGYSEEDAQRLRHEYQSNASKKGNIVKRQHPEYDSVHIEYWLAKGYSYDDAKQKLHERQSTFSLKTCIKKYGKTTGREIFQQRQQKWQNTLNKKSSDEKNDINIRKNIFLSFYDPHTVRDEKFWKKWKHICEARHLKYINNEDDAKQEIETLFKNTAYIFGKGINWFIEYSCPKYIYKVLKISKAKIRKWLLDLNINYNNVYQTNGKYNAYHMVLSTGQILVSKLEIIFYNMLIQYNLKIDEINYNYPNSNLQFDFKINGKYIEIAGLMSDKTYRSKILYKRDTFKCFVLTKKSEFNNFIQKVLIENNEKAIQYYLTRSL